MSPASSVSNLKGVGPKLTEILAKIDLCCIADLLFHLPLRYEDRTRITPIGALVQTQTAVVEGKVLQPTLSLPAAAV